MRGTCISIYKICFGKSLSIASVIALTSMFASVLAVYAQLPQTNMGQFVHQPGDNQYTSQTQAKRHVQAVVPVAVPNAPNLIPAPANVSYNSGYQITPAAPKPDISLLPIVADEPIKPAGFPPLPDRLDLPASGTGIWSGASGVAAQRTINGDSGQSSSAGVSHDPTGVHQHYVHYEAGAFMPSQAAPQANYRPASTDYYNVNPSARSAAANMPATIPSAASATATPAETPSTQALKRMGAEPKLAADAVTRPEAPTAVTVNQSVSQDLSLPEDDFNKHYPTNTGNSATSRTSRGIGQVIGYPLRSLGYTAVGVASYGAMYAIHR